MNEEINETIRAFEALDEEHDRFLEELETLTGVVSALEISQQIDQHFLDEGARRVTLGVLSRPGFFGALNDEGDGGQYLVGVPHRVGITTGDVAQVTKRDKSVTHRQLGRKVATIQVDLYEHEDVRHEEELDEETKQPRREETFVSDLADRIAEVREHGGVYLADPSYGMYGFHAFIAPSSIGLDIYHMMLARGPHEVLTGFVAAHHYLPAVESGNEWKQTYALMVEVAKRCNAEGVKEPMLHVVKE